MPELRWSLIGLSLLLLAGLALWEWRRSRRRHFTSTHVEPVVVHDPPERLRRAEPAATRLEPSIDGISGAAGAPDVMFDVPTIHPVEPLRVALSAGAAVDVPSAARLDLSGDDTRSAPAIQWPPQESTRVLSLRVAGARGEPLSGRSLRIALDAAGLRHGPQNIFHLATPEGAVLASVANLVQPGSFDPANMDAQQFRGLSVFSVLPGVLPPSHMLEELVSVARALAHRLGAVVQDASGQPLDDAGLAQLQQSVADEAP